MEHETFLRRAIELATQARAQDIDPYGAVLVHNGEIVHEVTDHCLILGDPTAHAEMYCIRDYCMAHGVFDLTGYALYASTEPCPMCSGAIHWSRISTVVYSVSQAMLQSMSGGSPKLPCRVVLNVERVNVIGPLLPDEGLHVFDGFEFISKQERFKK